MTDGILAVTEFADERFRKSSYEVVSEGRRLADQLNTTLTVVVLGSGVLAAAGELKHYGADRVLVCDDPGLADFDSDRFTPILDDIVTARQPRIVLFSASVRDKQLATRLAARRDAGLAMECTGLALEGQRSSPPARCTAASWWPGWPSRARRRSPFCAPTSFRSAPFEKAGEIERIEVKPAAIAGPPGRERSRASPSST